MIEVHVYGHLKKKIDSQASFAEDTIINLQEEQLTFNMILKKLNFSEEDCGECFINGKVVSNFPIDYKIPSGSRVAIFSSGMYLLCGGQHLKSHGFITNKKAKKLDYY